MGSKIISEFERLRSMEDYPSSGAISRYRQLARRHISADEFTDIYESVGEIVHKKFLRMILNR